jgi:hypothetical protein
MNYDYVYKGNTFNIGIRMENVTEKERDKIVSAAESMGMVFNTDDFKKFCTRYEYIRKTTTGHLWWKRTNSELIKGFHYTTKTGMEIYNHLLTGAESLSPETDNKADIFLRIDRSLKTSVIGYTYPNTNWQWIYSWVVRDWGVADIAGNLAHEWCHKMGYNHEFKYTDLRQYSVPYAVGYYVRDCVANRERIKNDLMRSHLKMASLA